jgi:hypothetical protein
MLPDQLGRLVESCIVESLVFVRLLVPVIGRLGLVFQIHILHGPT